MRVVVLFGGDSEERDVSIASAAKIVPALRTRGHEVLAVDTARGELGTTDENQTLTNSADSKPPSSRQRNPARNGVGLFQLFTELSKNDLVFLALHGGTGEDGRIQALLDLTGVPYTGSGALGSGLAMAKDISKTLMRAGGLLTPDWLTTPVPPEKAVRCLGLPVVVKPASQGSTVGLSIVQDVQDLGPAIDNASRYGTVMVEQFIKGREFTVGVLDGDPLVVGEILIPSNSAFSYNDKYQASAARGRFPAELPATIADTVRSMAVNAHQIHRLQGYSRSDFRIDDDWRVWIIETNSLPGLTETSLLPQSADAAGINYVELCDRICRSAIHAPNIS